MGRIVTAPGIETTHLDAKFRELVAKRVSSARFSFFYEDQVLSSGAIANEELIRKSYAEPLFSVIGDTVHIDIGGYFANNINNKQVHISVEDELGNVFGSYASAVFSGASLSGGIIYFNLKAMISLTGDKSLGVHAGIVTNSAIFTDAFSGLTLVPYSAAKCNIIIESTGGAANDVVLNVVKAEFSPGFLG